MIGKTLAHYRVVEKIGAGGMGEVYRATDRKLGRDVALKLLPPAFAGSPERMARFEREARVLASLNHPGIASIFGIEHDGGLHFLAMELALGDDLATRLRRGPLPVPEAISVARQIAEALEEAHRRGFVHRDLKPANIKVGPDGTVKILDFGLARALDDGFVRTAQDDSPTIGAEMTGAGVILGTAAYMSPEQARGEVADARADIWAFGCVLWECVTGTKLFDGKSASDQIGAVLRDEPDWDVLPPEVPSHVRRLLRRCLAKRPADRLHHMADVRIELEDDFEHAPAESVTPEVTRVIRRTRNAARISWILLLAAIGVFVVDRTVRESHSGALQNPLDGARFTRLTDFPGEEFEAALSRDGRFVAFVSNRDGPFDIFVGQIGSGEFRNLTQNRADSSFGDVRAPVRSVGFTWDGTHVWLGGGTGHRLRTVSLLGGPLRNFLGERVVNLDWSPDGREIAYHERTAGDPVYRADANGANSRMILESPEGNHQHYMTWSPDAKWIYLVRGRPTTGDMNLWRLRPDGSSLEQLSSDKRNVTYPVPIDTRTVLFCAQERDGAGPWLWALDVESRVSRRVTYGLEHYTSLAASADGTRLVATVENARAVLWSVPLRDRVVTESDAHPYAVPSVRALAPRFGRNDDLFYLSSRGTGDGLWRYRDGKALEIWSGSDTALLEPAAVSPDGALVAIVLRGETGRRLHVLTTDGAEIRALTGALDVHGSVSWSPDGRWLAAGGSEAGTLGLFKVPVDGGPAQRILEGEALSPVWSPRGDLIVYGGAQVQAVARLVGVSPDGRPVELPDIEILREISGARVRFLPDGSGLVYMQGLSSSQDFYLLDLESMQRRRLTRLDESLEMRTFDITPDGSTIVFDRMRRNSDIVLIELAGRQPALVQVGSHRLHSLTWRVPLVHADRSVGRTERWFDRSPVATFLPSRSHLLPETEVSRP